MANKPVKEVMVAFRLTEKEADDLQQAFDKQPMVGVKSRNVLARKLAIDWSRGRLRYRSKRDLLLAPDVNQS